MNSSEKLQRELLTTFRDRLLLMVQSKDNPQILDIILICVTSAEIICKYPISNNQEMQTQLIVRDLERIHKHAIKCKIDNSLKTYKLWDIVTDSTLSIKDISQQVADCIDSFLEIT